jgi:hypothetical protein
MVIIAITKTDQTRLLCGESSILRRKKMTFGMRGDDCRSAKRGVAHAEARAHMFGEKFDRGTIAHRVGLRQILHGFHQGFLPINIAWVSGALSFSAADDGDNRNGKDFGHEEIHHLRIDKAVYLRVFQFSALIFGF